MQSNQTKAKIRRGETALGCFMRTPAPGLVEFLGYQGWDFLVFDGEHGPIDPRQCEDLVRAAELRGITPIGRVPVNSHEIILRYMDSGLQGVHVPTIESGAAAATAIESIKYHPLGSRGLAGVRAAAYGQALPLPEYVQRANAETMSILHVETVAGVDALPEILATPQLDVAFIGPTDLSQSLGLPGQTDHPDVVAAVDRAAEQIVASGVALGIIVGSAAAARAWQARGARYIVITLETLLAGACRAFLAEARR